MATPTSTTMPNSVRPIEFYDRWRDPIRRALALAIGDVAIADEAVDEAMTRALASWDRIGGYERPEGWLYRVGLNWARGLFRKRRYEIVAQLDHGATLVDADLPDVNVIAAVGRLSFRLRTVVVARDYLDWSTGSGCSPPPDRAANPDTVGGCCRRCRGHRVGCGEVAVD